MHVPDLYRIHRTTFWFLERNDETSFKCRICKMRAPSEMFENHQVNVQTLHNQLVC